MSAHPTTTRRHVCRDGASCVTKLEVHCACGFGQGASCLEHAVVIASGHAEDPKLPVVTWQRTA